MNLQGEKQRATEYMHELMAYARNLFRKTEAEYRKRRVFHDIDEAYGMMDGSKHWPEDLKRELEEEGRAAHVIHQIFPIVQLLSGMERQASTDIVVTAAEPDDEISVELVNSLLRDYRRRVRWSFENSEAFYQALIWGAYVEYYVEQSDDLSVEIKRRIIDNPKHVMFDPRSTDIFFRDAEYCFHAYWEDVRKVVQLRPDLADSVTGYAMEAEEAMSGSVKMRRNENYQETDPDVLYGPFYQSTVDGEPRIRIIRFWRYRYKPVYRVLMPDGRIVETNEERAQKAQAIGAKVRRINKRYVEYIEFAGDSVIEYVGDIRISAIPVIPLFLLKVGTKRFGPVKLVIDQQREIDVWYSRATDLIARIHDLGGIYEEDAIPRDVEIEINNLKRGDWLKVSKGALTQGKVQPGKPANLRNALVMLQIAQQNKEDMRQALGAHDVLQGIRPKGVEAGYALDLLRRQSATIVEPLYDRFNEWKMICTRLEVEMILNFYSVEKAQRILGGIVKKAGPEVEQEMLQRLQQLLADRDELERHLETARTIRYDFAVVEGYKSVTTAQFLYMTLMGLMKLGFPVPPQIVIDTIPFLDKSTKEMWRKIAMQQLGPTGAGGNGGVPGGASLEQILSQMAQGG